MYIIITTTKNPDKLAKMLVKNHYAACVSSYPINSTYFWNNRLYNDKEFMVLIKTARLRKTISFLKKIHDYDLPEIIYIRVGASKEYSKWVQENS